MVHRISELLWLKIILDDLKIEEKDLWNFTVTINSPLTLHTIRISITTLNTKHIEVERNFIKEKIDSGLIIIPYLLSSDQLADVLNKGLPTLRFQEITSKLVIEDIYSAAWEGFSRWHLFSSLRGSLGTPKLLFSFCRVFLVSKSCIICSFIVTIPNS